MSQDDLTLVLMLADRAGALTLDRFFGAARPRPASATGADKAYRRVAWRSSML